MLSLTRKSDYALLALAKLAAVNPDADSPISVRQIAEEFGMPLSQLMNVFKDLQRAGIVRSARGAHGGYFMATDPDQIRLIQVIETIEGPVRLTICCDEEEEACVECNIIRRCTITKSMQKVNDRIVDYLRSITIKDLITSEVDVVVSNMRTPVDSNGPLTRTFPLAKEHDHNQLTRNDRDSGRPQV